MNSLINNVIIFSLGAAIGSLVTCRVLYNKAFDKAYAEADAKWREHYDNKDEKPQEESEETEDKSEIGLTQWILIGVGALLVIVVAVVVIVLVSKRKK